MPNSPTKRNVLLKFVGNITPNTNTGGKNKLSRNQRGVAARKECVQRIVDAGRRNSAATVGARAMVTVENEAISG
jgi:hypothetical protein